MWKPGSWYLLAKCLKNTCEVTFYVKIQVDDLHLTDNVTLPKAFFKHFASKNQLPGFYIGRTSVENELIRNCNKLIISGQLQRVVQ